MSDSNALLWRRGFWDENAALVQLLGICPLLAVTTKVVYGLGLGIATLLVATLSNASVSLLRRFLTAEIRIPAYVLIIATLVTCIEMLLAAFLPGLQRGLGIFVALIVTNCLIVARAETFARHNTVGASIVDGLATGSGFLAALVAIGFLRELVGSLSVFADMALLFDTTAASAPPAREGLRLALLPPGAFLGLALVIALSRYWRKGSSTPE
ncbi:MAG: electron transport complex subunit RsxE [Pseudomonadota bacterium]